MILEAIDGNMSSFIYVDILKRRRLLRNFPALSPYTVQETELNNNNNQLIFQQDGAKVHKAKDVFEYFDGRDIQVLEFPPKSPNLNLIQLKHKKKSIIGNTRRWRIFK